MFDYNEPKRLPLFLRSLTSGERCTLCREGMTHGLGILCPECKAELETEAAYVCSGCGALVCDCVCTTDRMKKAGIDCFIKLFPYFGDEERTSGKLLYHLKSRSDRQLSNLVAAELAPKIVPYLSKSGCSFEEIAVTYIPRSRNRIRENGTDQAKEAAVALSKALGVDCLELVSRESNGSVQKKLGNDDRFSNVSGMFTLKGRVPECVILYDDLVTTGATICSTAATLKSGGARVILCVSIAHTVGKGADYFNPQG